MNDLYIKLNEYEPTRQERIRQRSIKKGDEFKPFAAFAKALKSQGWLFRDVIDFLYKNELQHIQQDKRIDNNFLIKKLHYWQKNGVYSEIDVVKEKEKIKENLNSNNTTESNKIYYSLLDFLDVFKKSNVYNTEDDTDLKKRMIAFYKIYYHDFETKERMAKAFMDKEKEQKTI